MHTMKYRTIYYERRTAYVLLWPNGLSGTFEHAHRDSAIPLDHLTLPMTQHEALSLVLLPLDISLIDHLTLPMTQNEALSLFLLPLDISLIFCYPIVVRQTE